MSLKNKKELFLIGLVIIGALIIIFLFFFRKNIGETINEYGTANISPLELANNKEKYRGKEIVLQGAFVPSEAFIYINLGSLEDKIYIDPPNRSYCKNFNFKGILEWEELVKRWKFFIKESVCLDKK